MSKKQLLLIEDEGYVIDRVNDLLKEFPQFEVNVCTEAGQARELLGSRPFDIVITCVYLRGASGLEFSFKAREKNPDTCVIVLAGLDALEMANKAVKEGALDFVIKPAALERLTNILKMVTLVRGLAAKPEKKKTDPGA